VLKKITAYNGAGNVLRAPVIQRGVVIARLIFVISAIIPRSLPLLCESVKHKLLPVFLRLIWPPEFRRLLGESSSVLGQLDWMFQAAMVSTVSKLKGHTVSSPSVSGSWENGDEEILLRSVCACTPRGLDAFALVWRATILNSDDGVCRRRWCVREDV
jgi:hypothetical protein